MNNNKIAIVGLDFRFPKSPDKESFWNLLANKQVAITEVPRSRWNWEDYWGNPDKETNKTAVKWGGFIDDIDKFDSTFFKMSPRESLFMDPYQRLLLQSTWHAFEDAGYNPDHLAGSKTGVFVGSGVGLFGYVDLLTQYLDVDAYTATGNCFSVIANRLSWFYDFSGPSESIDTACASSLTALNRAVKSIQSGECNTAVVATAAINDNPLSYVAFDMPGMLSRTGEIIPFDNSANGYVRGEGFGSIIIKRFADAVNDGDHVYGIIRGIEVSHTGRVSSMTVPSAEAQADLVSSVCIKNDVPVDTINYIEAHGTGTPVGDPLEIEGLKRAWEKMRKHFNLPMFAEKYCTVGTVKANIGHLEPASGFAGLMKTLLALQHKKIPAHPTIKKISPNCKLEKTAFTINTEIKEWNSLYDRTGKVLPRRAIVNSYGFGGANASLLLEEYQSQLTICQEKNEDHLFVFSAQKPTRLLEIVNNFISYLLKGKEEDSIGDIAYTLQAGRREMKTRLAVIANSRSSLLGKLVGFLQGETLDNVFCNTDLNLKKVSPVSNDDLVALMNNNGGADSITNHLIKSKNLAQLAKLWIKGLNLHLNKKDPKGNYKRVPLPTYPFERKSFWYREMDQAETEEKYYDKIQAENNKITFSKVLTGQEFYLEDHRFKGQCILPAAMQLELIRLALKEGNFADQNIAIRNAVWMKPILVNSPIEIQVEISLKDGTAENFRILSKTTSSKENVYSQGKIISQANLLSKIKDIAVPMQKLSRSKKIAKLYQEFREEDSLSYGPTFQVIESLIYNSEECLAELKHKGIPEELTQYKLHPSLLDGAFQALKVIMDEDPDERIFLPFSVDRLEIYQPLEGKCKIYAKKSEESKDSIAFSIYILNETGNTLAYLENFRLRVIESNENNSFHLYETVWQKKDYQSNLNFVPQTLLYFGANNELPKKLGFEDYLLVRQGNGFGFSEKNHTITIDPSSQNNFHRLFQEIQKRGKQVSHIIYQWDQRGMEKLSLDDAPNSMYEMNSKLLWLAQSLISESLKKPVLLVSLTNLQTGEVDRYYGAMAGFWRSISLEIPKFSYKSLTLYGANPEEEVALLRKEFNNSDVEVKYDQNTRFVKELWNIDIKSSESTPNVTTLKKDGVYVITGGLGAIGQELASHLAKKYQANLILTDRVKLKDHHQSKLKILSNKGAKVKYIEGDIISAQNTKNIIKLVDKQYEKCDGIFHCAGITRDSVCLKKTIQDMEDVGSPKTFGTIAVQEIADTCQADFVVCFSSLSSVLGNAGQTDYAFANRFMDSHGQYKNTQENGAKWFSMQWSLWESGGMSMPKEALTYLKKRAGFIPLKTKAAFSALEYCLKNGISLAAVLQGNKSKINRYLDVTEVKSMEPIFQPILSKTAARPVKITEHPSIQDTILNICSNELKIDVVELDVDEDFSEYGADSIMLTRIATQLEEKYSIELNPASLVDYRTIGSLANYLAQMIGIEETSSRDITESIPDQITIKETNIIQVPSVSHQSIEDTILNICSSELKIDAAELDVDEDFSEYGADSIMLTRIATQLEEKYSIELNPASLVDYRTIGSLANYLAQLIGTTESSSSDLIETTSPEVTEIKNITTQTTSVSVNSIQDTILKICSSELKIDVDELDVDEDFSEYGADSIMLTRIATQLEEIYAIELNPASLVDYRTIGSLANYLAGLLGGDTNTSTESTELEMMVTSGDPHKGSFLDKRISSLNARGELVTSLGYDFFEKRIDQYDGSWVVTNNRRMLMLASYSYLGLIGHPKINAAAQACINKFGSGTHGVRMLAGTTSTHHELEETIAKFKKTESAIVYSSGYVANLTTISTLTNSEDTIICDAYNHTSIMDGCKLSNANFCYFNHNDMNHLEQCLEKAEGGGKLVIVDSVFSMDGDIADLPSIVALCKKYNAALMVDEAHSVGALGKTGRGIEEHFNLNPHDIDIKMGTLSKTIPGAGGYVASTKKIVNALKANGNAFIFSAALPSPIAAAAKAAFEVIEEEPQRVAKLHKNVERYINGIKKMGFNTLYTESPVVPIICNTEAKTFEMTKICHEEGLFVLPVVYPAVPINLPRLRTTVTAEHSFDEIDFALDVFQRAGKATRII